MSKGVKLAFEMLKGVKPEVREVNDIGLSH